MANLNGKNLEASSSTHKSYNQNEGKQSENAQQFPDTDNDDCMQCNVCWDQIKIDQLCFCDHLMVSKSASSSSNPSHGNNNDQIKNKAANEGKSKPETHVFCSGCLEEYTKAAHEMMPFTKNGLGLKCMALNCENPITWQEIRSFIPVESIRALENQCAELCVALSGLDIVERCPKCNCAVDMNGTTADEKMLFHCPGAECGYEMCRKCNEKWADEHNYLNCEQFAKQNNLQKYQNETPFDEKRLSEVVVHKCHKCNIQFIKDEGCNYVTCTRCKATHCYCCQMPDINSNHFCGCVPKMPCNDNPCKCSKSECGKCLLTKDVAELEKLIMERIRKEINEKIEKKVATEADGRVWSYETSPARNFQPPMLSSSSGSTLQGSTTTGIGGMKKNASAGSMGGRAGGGGMEELLDGFQSGGGQSGTGTTTRYTGFGNPAFQQQQQQQQGVGAVSGDELLSGALNSLSMEKRKKAGRIKNIFDFYKKKGKRADV
uniref:RING-type domain-containing protein n=1 Tax=Globodera rostochiensis TaxID=31243 RepID=A0A914H4A8_GLORO